MSSEDMPGARLADLAWTQVRPRLARGDVAVLPIGAVAKEHGPHLPMDTDWRTAEALGLALAERARVLVWPSVGYGFYPAFIDYPGSTSLSEATFEATIEQLLADIARAGARHALVINTGISTIRAVDAAIAKSAMRCLSAHVYRGHGYLRAHAACITQERGHHADEAETSVMLHLWPERVRMDRAVSSTREVRPGRWSPDDPSSPGYSPSGVYGDATRASAETGRALVSAMIDDLEHALAMLLAAQREGSRST